MLKIIQVTDCHLVAPGRRLFTLDPARQLSRAVEDINRHHGDAALCVLTGDLAHDGEPAAYAVLREILAGLSMPWRLLPGNHDDRAALTAAFPRTPTDGNGFLQSVVPTAEGHLMLLDTVDPGVHSGAYCADRCAWLERKLGDAGDRPVFLFMHHPPMAIGMPRLDQYRIRDSAGLTALLRRAPTVRHLFFGHVHRPVSGGWHGIPFSALRGTCHQNWLDLTSGRVNISSLEPPGYGIVLIHAEGTIVHHHDFADASPRFAYDPDAPEGAQIRPLLHVGA